MKRIRALTASISSLLLIVLATIASIMLYVWFTGYSSSQIGKTTSLSGIVVSIKQATAVDNATNDRVIVVIAIQNIGNEKVRIDSKNDITIMINGKVYTPTGITPPTTITITVSSPPLLPPNTLNLVAFRPIRIAPGATVVIAAYYYSSNQDLFRAGQAVDITVSVEANGVSSGTTYTDSASTTVYAR